MIDAVASEPQYLTHILPIWRALPSSIRGTLYTVNRLLHLCGDLNFSTRPSPHRILNPTIVASYGDYKRAVNRPIIFVEHGSGQTYPNAPDHSAYSGGAGRERVILFINPSPTVANRNLARYPDIACAVVGCPALDEFHPPRSPTTPGLVAITFHSDLRLAPESASAFREFYPGIQALASTSIPLLGHGHPRIYRRLKPFYDRWGIPSTPDRREVMARASVLIADNTSLAFEFASLSRPIVWMTPTFYRRDITAWPRFWDGLILGEHATCPDELPDAITRALAPVPSTLQHDRDNFIDTVYAVRDGSASSRAVDAILSLPGVTDA